MIILIEKDSKISILIKYLDFIGFVCYTLAIVFTLDANYSALK